MEKFKEKMNQEILVDIGLVILTIYLAIYFIKLFKKPKEENNNEDEAEQYY